MLAQHRIVFLDRKLFRHGAGVLLGDIEEAGFAFAVEANFGGGRFGHGRLQRTVERAGFWGRGPLFVKPKRPQSPKSAFFALESDLRLAVRALALVGFARPARPGGPR